MDRTAIFRHQLARPAPRPQTAHFAGVADLLARLPRELEGQPIDWSWRDGQRLLFVLWLLDHGRLDQVTPEFVFVRTNAGRIHKAVKAAGERYTNEACNLDDAPGQEVEVTFADLERADPSDLCQQPSCFGEPEGAAA
jgi:hypothetical protein